MTTLNNLQQALSQWRFGSVFFGGRLANGDCPLNFASQGDVAVAYLGCATPRGSRGAMIGNSLLAAIGRLGLQQREQVLRGLEHLGILAGIGCVIENNTANGNTEGRGRYSSNVRAGVTRLLHYVTTRRNATSKRPAGYIKIDKDDFAAVSFVGATKTAEHIFRTGTHHGKRVQALGGAKNHMIIMPDADMEQTADAVFITDRRGCIEYVNAAFERTTGCADISILGRLMAGRSAAGSTPVCGGPPKNSLTKP